MTQLSVNRATVRAMTDDGIIWPIPRASLRTYRAAPCHCGGRRVPLHRADETTKEDLVLIVNHRCLQCGATDD